MATSMDYKYLEMGYHYLMGRGLDADGSIRLRRRLSGVAPRSIFYGGRLRRCCPQRPRRTLEARLSTPAQTATPGTLAKLRRWRLGQFRPPSR